MQVERSITVVERVQPGAPISLQHIHEARRALGHLKLAAKVVRLAPEDWFSLMYALGAEYEDATRKPRPWGYSWRGLDFHLEQGRKVGEWCVETAADTQIHALTR